MRGCVAGHDGDLVEGKLTIGELTHHRRQLAVPPGDPNDRPGPKRGEPGPHGQPVLGGADPCNGPRLVIQGLGHDGDQPRIRRVEHTTQRGELLLGLDLRAGRDHAFIVHQF